MTLSEIITLGEQLEGIYGDRCPPLTAGMATIWLAELRPYTAAILHLAMIRWASEHLTIQAPKLKDLSVLALTITDEREHESRKVAAQARPQGGSYHQVLQQAADATPYDTWRWAHLHVEMFLKGLCAPGHYDEAAALCEQYARDYPEEVQAWYQEAAWWRGGAIGRQETVMYGHESQESATLGMEHTT